MKMKTTRQQLEAVELALRLMLSENKPTNPAEKLIYDIVYKLYCRVRMRVERITPTKSGWSLKLTEQEALALHVFVTNYPMPVGYTYEELQIDTIYYKIDQEYGKLICGDSQYRMLAT